MRSSDTQFFSQISSSPSICTGPASPCLSVSPALFLPSPEDGYRTRVGPAYKRGAAAAVGIFGADAWWRSADPRRGRSSQKPHGSEAGYDDDGDQ